MPQRYRTPSEVPREAKRWLERRCLIDDELRLTIPVLGRFVREEILEPGA